MRGGGAQDPSRNPNSYPMTDEVRFPSAVTVRANGVVAGRYELPDDPADHRGILSWHAQLKDRRLRGSGSYGDLLEVPLPRAALEGAAAEGPLQSPRGVDQARPARSSPYLPPLRPSPLPPTSIFHPNH